MSNFYDPPNSIPLGGNPLETVALQVTATGSTQAGAAPITAAFTQVGTCASGAGVILPTSPGQEFTIRNDSGTACLIYPPVGGVIGQGGAVNAAATLSTATSTTLMSTTSAQASTPSQFLKIV